MRFHCGQIRCIDVIFEVENRCLYLIEVGLVRLDEADEYLTWKNGTVDPSWISLMTFPDDGQACKIPRIGAIRISSHQNGNVIFALFTNSHE